MAQKRKPRSMKQRRPYGRLARSPEWRRRRLRRAIYDRTGITFSRRVDIEAFCRRLSEEEHGD